MWTAQAQKLEFLASIIVIYTSLTCFIVVYPDSTAGANAPVQPAPSGFEGHQTQPQPYMTSLTPAAALNSLQQIGHQHRASTAQLYQNSNVHHGALSTTPQPQIALSHQNHGHQMGQSKPIASSNILSTTTSPPPTTVSSMTTTTTTTTTTPAYLISYTLPVRVTAATSTTLTPQITMTETSDPKLPTTMSPGSAISAASTTTATVTTQAVDSVDNLSMYTSNTGMISTQSPDTTYLYTHQPNRSFEYFPSGNFDEHSGGPVLERQNLDNQESSASQNSPSSSSINSFANTDLQHVPTNEFHEFQPPIVTAPLANISSQMSNISTHADQPTLSSSNSSSLNDVDDSTSNITEIINKNDLNATTTQGFKPVPVNPEARSSSNISSELTNVSTSTNSSTPRVQILRPRLKFNCSNSIDCKNDGLCHRGICFCAPGFTGESCDTNIDECRQFAGGQPCLNNGVCVDEVNEFRCNCPPGFRGDRCQDLADMCNDSPCLNNAKCINHRTSYTCKCEPGWEGKHCEIDIDDCAKNPCHNGAACYDLVNSYRCECQSGFSGTNCEININDCANNPCQNNATCRDLINDYECECLPGFSGKNCDENIDDCSSSPCMHGKCTDLINGFKCTCHDGWTGELCDNDINECDNGRPVCLNGGTCENLQPSYQCRCREGWTGRNCSDISDNCKAKKPCGKFGTCKNINIPKNSFQCECQSGYIGNKCERKRDCSNECHSHHAHCVSNITCACLPGRREERIMCEYVASCEQVEGELCLNGGTCKNLETGGYHCLCPEPFYGPICQLMAEKQFDAVLFVIIACVAFLLVACAVVSLLVFRSVRKARATRGTYSPSTQEKFGNSASDLLKPPIPERLI